MAEIISPDNSFIRFTAAPIDGDPCADIFPSCLPVSSFDDLSIQFQVVSEEDPPTVVLKIGGTTLDALNHQKLGKVNIDGTNFWLTVDTDCCDILLALASLNEHFSGTGTWNIDPHTGNISCTGDIHAFASDLSAYGITYTIECPCYIHITNPGDPPMAIADLIGYMQDNYPMYGIWSDIDAAGTVHDTRLYAFGDLCHFDTSSLNAAMIALGHTGFDSTIVTDTVGCEMHLDTFTCSDANVVDYLNAHYGGIGTWSIDMGKIVCTGNISAFAGTIPCVTYTIDNDGTPQYTHLFYGDVKKTGHALDEYVGEGDCFALTATVDGDTFTSNCLRYSADTCFTTRIRYRSNENVFGFIFFVDDGSGGNLIPNLYNTLRLYFYLRHPMPKANEEVYRRSDGNYALLSSVMENIWEGIVDMGNADYHRCLFVALGNDDFECWDDDKSAWKQYQKDGEYNVKWEKAGGFVLDSAPAIFTVKEAPFHNFNSNCK